MNIKQHSCLYRGLESEELLLHLLSMAFKTFHLNVKNLTPIFKIAQEKKEAGRNMCSSYRKDLSS